MTGRGVEWGGLGGGHGRGQGHGALAGLLRGDWGALGDWFAFFAENDWEQDASGGAAGSSLFQEPTLITPAGPGLSFSFSAFGEAVQGTPGDDVIKVGSGAVHVNGGAGDDTIVFDPARAAGADRMVFMDGGPGADIYRLVAEPGTNAALPACLIFDSSARHRAPTGPSSSASTRQR